MLRSHTDWMSSPLSHGLFQIGQRGRFAIKPWTNVRWENMGTKITDGMAIAMGNYYFTPAEGGDDVKVEYSFAYVLNSDGKLKIVLHDSHLPYNPAA